MSSSLSLNIFQTQVEITMAKIKTIEHFRVLPRWLFVKITDEQGGCGWGESTLEGHSESIEGTLNAFSRQIQGYEAE